MQRVHVDGPRVEAGTLQRLQQPLPMRVEVLGGVPDLEHAHLVAAVSGVERPSLGLAARPSPRDP